MLFEVVEIGIGVTMSTAATGAVTFADYKPFPGVTLSREHFEKAIELYRGLRLQSDGEQPLFFGQTSGEWFTLFGTYRIHKAGEVFVARLFTDPIGETVFKSVTETAATFAEAVEACRSHWLHS